LSVIRRASTRKDYLVCKIAVHLHEWVLSLRLSLFLYTLTHVRTVAPHLAALVGAVDSGGFPSYSRSCQSLFTPMATTIHM